MNVILLTVRLDQPRFKSFTNRLKHLPQSINRITVKDFSAIFRDKDQMDV